MAQQLPTLPDFVQGFEEGTQAFREGVFFPEHNKRWTEDDIIRLVNEELSGGKYRRMKRYDELQGRISLSYLHHLGFVVGYIHQALNHDHLHDIIA